MTATMGNTLTPRSDRVRVDVMGIRWKCFRQKFENGIRYTTNVDGTTTKDVLYFEDPTVNMSYWEGSYTLKLKSLYADIFIPIFVFPWHTGTDIMQAIHSNQQYLPPSLNRNIQFSLRFFDTGIQIFNNIDDPLYDKEDQKRRNTQTMTDLGINENRTIQLTIRVNAPPAELSSRVDALPAESAELTSLRL